MTLRSPTVRSLAAARRKLGMMLSLMVAVIGITLISCQSESVSSPLPTASTPSAPASAIELPPLPYDYSALEPYIDAETMQLHHDKHHAAYVNNLNDALSQYPDLQNQSLVALIQDLDSVPEAIRRTVQNNGGGHLNHTMFWEIMAPESGGEPTGAIATAIDSTFGSFDSFKQQFEQAGLSQFGSGWVWLVLNPQRQLQIITTANQDSPLMQGLYPLLGNDVWEHAYYLSYRNRRAEYLGQWWNVVNWAEVDRRFSEADV